ncbi:MAG TPA: TraR/DksA C4-type zinc finger protein, partial [Anaerolineae bacterium]|nr:TraR/DksA C4-type zinc finger protein [Anaerolineae bacterium]
REEDDQLPEAERRQRARDRMQSMGDEELYDVRWVDAPLPGPARIFKTVQCGQCGEGVMEARARLRDGQPVCPECYGEVYTRRLV